MFCSLFSHIILPLCLCLSPISAKSPAAFFPSSLSSSNSPQSTEINDVKGVSVHHLSTTFMDKAKKLTNKHEGECTANISDIVEPLIKKKGQSILCPRDGKMGAAYVDCLEGTENVGKANLLLSCARENSLEDICTTLNSYCSSHDLDPRKTYVWMSCLSINQHRYNVDNPMSYEEWEQTFDDTAGIKNRVLLMSPWNEPHFLVCMYLLYLIFSIFTFFFLRRGKVCLIFIFYSVYFLVFNIKAMRSMSI